MQVGKYNGSLSEVFLSCVEQYWEFGLPKDYRFFLLSCNGGCPDRTYFNFKNSNDGSRLESLFGFIKDFSNNILIYSKERGDRFPENFLPIGNDTFGNLILLSVKGSDRGKVYFWDHEMEADPVQGEIPSYDNLTLISDSFDEFMNSLYAPDE